MAVIAHRLVKSRESHIAFYMAFFVSHLLNEIYVPKIIQEA